MKLRFLGIAHGWAGILYATLLWCRTAGRDLPPACEDRLQQLAALGEDVGHGMRWPIKIQNRHQHTERDYMTGWCNGSAGFVFLWTMAHRALGDELYATLARKAAWNTWEGAVDFDSLCCGLAGSAYALLNLFRSNGDPVWLDRACALANRAVVVTKSSELPRSLYKGTMGVAVLVTDLANPETACMPLFERAFCA